MSNLIKSSTILICYLTVTTLLSLFITHSETWKITLSGVIIIVLAVSTKLIIKKYKSRTENQTKSNTTQK